MIHKSDKLSKFINQTCQLYGKKLYFNEKPENVSSFSSSNLESFYQAICKCQKCPLGQSRTNFVYGSGNSQADIVFVGEAPGAKEDLEGLPFVGRAGKLLDKMLAAIDLTRENIYICNVLHLGGTGLLKKMDGPS